jgi:hypothetical protein
MKKISILILSCCILTLCLFTVAFAADSCDDPPPIPDPCCDHPDDTFSVDSGNPLLQSYLSSDPHAVILKSGYYNEFGNLLSKVKKSSVRADIDSAVSDLLSSSKVLIIPSVGLYGLENSVFLKATLDEYVKQGGTLIVFAQQHGYEFSILPVPQEADGTYKKVNGYGWGEDQSCLTNAAFLQTYHQILSGQSRNTPSLNVDGYFSSYPSTATVLLRRTANGQAALLMYDYGQGKVIVTSMYSDYAFAHSQATSEETALVRDMIAWAKKPAQLPEIGLGQSVSLPVTLTNITDLQAASAKLIIYDPDRTAAQSEQAVSVSLATGASATVTAQYAAPANAKLGIYHVDYILYDTQGNVVQPPAETDSGRFVVSNPPKQGSPDKPIWFTVTTPSQEVLYGEPMNYTFHIYNNTDQTRNFTIKNYFRHTGRTHTWSVTATPNSETTLTSSDAFTDGYMYETMASTLYDESNNQIGKYELSFKAISFSASVTVKSDKKVYDKGETVNLALNVQNKLTSAYPVTLKIKVLAPSNTVIFSTDISLNLPASGALPQNVSFVLPQAMDRGYCTVLAEVFDTKGNRIGSNSAIFEVPQFSLAVVPALPDFFSGNNEISFTIENKGIIAVPASTLSVSLTDPSGLEIWANQAQAPSLIAGQSTLVSFSMPIQALIFGEYKVSYLLSYDGGTKNGSIIVPNKAVFSLVFDKPAYKNGDTANLTLNLANTGRFNFENALVTVSVPDLNYAGTQTINEQGGNNLLLNFAIPIPATVTAGQHDTNVSLTISSGSVATQNIKLVIPESSLDISYSGADNLNAGNTVILSVENTGGLDTNYTTEKLAITDSKGVVIYQGELVWENWTRT